MSDEQTTGQTTDEPTPARGWRDLWQVPVLLVAVALMVGGIVAAFATRPDPDLDGALDRAQRQVQAEAYTEAIETLNRTIYPYLEREELTVRQRQRYHMLLARSIYLGQERLGIELDENWMNVIAEYREAENADAVLEPTDAYFLGVALASVDRLDAAVARADGLPDARRDLRHRLYDRVVAREMARGTPDYDRVLSWLGVLLAEADLPREKRIWGIARQAEVLLRRGFAEEAVNTVLRAMPRLMGGPKDDLAELYTLLGRAYLEIGAVDPARKNLRAAEDARSADPGVNAWVQVMLGRIDELEDRPEEARDRYDLVVRKMGDTPAGAEALLALAEVEAALELDDAALVSYRQLTERLGEGSIEQVSTDRVIESLMDRARERLGLGRYELALQFAEIAESIHGVAASPAPVLLLIAEASAAQADELLPPREDGRVTRLSEAGLDPATREAARPFLVRAASYFQLHADRVVLEDNERYGESLWRSADAYDRAGDEASAIAAFRAYADGFPDSPRRAQAIFRLAQANQSRGEYELAAGLYSELVAAREDREGGKGVGRWADASYVPLAQCLLLDEDPANDAQAERLLTDVVEGALGTPESVNYPEALLELGHLYYRMGRYPESIERLDEAVRRFPDSPNIERMRYRLGDAYRLEARAIEKTLTGALPDAERRELTAARADRLERAKGLFEQVRDALGQADPRRLSELDRLYLRNASFYVGDCAFDLGDYAGAIRAYDAARQRYTRDPASLVALVQIVNAHVAQGDMERARTANERARRFYESLPPDVWEDPSLPMTRGDWERWLDSSTALYSLDTSS